MMIKTLLRRPLLLSLNLVTYIGILAMMGSCSHFSEKDPLVNFEAGAKLEKPVLVLQYSLENLPEDEHSLYFRDSAGDLVKVDVPGELKTNEGFLVELANNRAYQLEAISFGERNFLLKELTQKFTTKKDSINYLGAMNFKLTNEDLIYSVKRPVESMKALATIELNLNIKPEQMLNPYTGKNLAMATSPTKVQLKSGQLTGSFTDYIKIINPCYVEEWKTNPLILGKLDFRVTESNGVLRVKNLESNHSASEGFEQCVWTNLSASIVTDADFKIQIPGVLYF